jgi:hypothetical protein
MLPRSLVARVARSSGALSGQPLIGDPLDETERRGGQSGAQPMGGKKRFTLTGEEKVDPISVGRETGHHRW